MECGGNGAYLLPRSLHPPYVLHQYCISATNIPKDFKRWEYLCWRQRLPFRTLHSDTLPHDGALRSSYQLHLDLTTVTTLPKSVPRTTRSDQDTLLEVCSSN